MDKFYDLPLIDCHVHITSVTKMSKVENVDSLLELMRACNYSAMNVVNIVQWPEQNILRNPLTILLKFLSTKMIYGFGGLTYPDPKKVDKSFDYAGQAKKLIDMGFDGIKMFGKPNVRKEFGVPLDSPIFDEFFRYAEKESIPILFHVGDPETFWDTNLAPKWAYEKGWFYGDGTYPEKETLYREIDGLLNKFPKLRMVLPHFYFMSGDIKRAAEFLDNCADISFDITPGSEMYGNFSKDPDMWHDFFVKYQDRILFGTDITGGNGPQDSSHILNAVKHIEAIRTFLETDMVYRHWNIDIRGIYLDKTVVEKIYAANFRNFAGYSPKELKPDLALAECERLMDLAMKSPLKNEILPEMCEVMRRLEKIFS